MTPKRTKVIYRTGKEAVALLSSLIWGTEIDVPRRNWRKWRRNL